MKTINKILFIVLFFVISLLNAGLTTANVLQQVVAGINAYNFIQADITEYGNDSGDFSAEPVAGQYATANYYFSKSGVSNNLTAMIEYQTPVTEIRKIINGAIYINTPSGDFKTGDLETQIFTNVYPGFEQYLLSLMTAVSINQVSTDNYKVTADINISSNIKQAILYVSENYLTKVEFLVSGNNLIQTILFKYGNSGGLYLSRVGLKFAGVSRVSILKFTLPDKGPLDNGIYAFNPGKEETYNDTPPPAPEPFPIGGDSAKYYEGSKLTPFASYGVAGEDIPGESGVLQLAYTDLELPGINGLNVSIKRSYNSQQFRANPKPTSFKENPYQLDYSPRRLLDDYSLILPDGWGGWMGKGWQLDIGGELYINEIYSLSVVGPIFPPGGETEINSSTVRNYTFQTANGYRMDFAQEHQPDPVKIVVGVNNLLSLQGGLMNFRKDLEENNDIEAPSRYIKAKDPRAKMKMEVVNDNHYILYAPDGKKYHFEKKIFQKNAEWSKDWSVGSYFGRNKAFVGVKFVSKIFYLTSIEDSQGNLICINYEKVFDKSSDSKTRSARAYSEGVNVQNFLETKAGQMVEPIILKHIISPIPLPIDINGLYESQGLLEQAAYSSAKKVAFDNKANFAEVYSADLTNTCFNEYTTKQIFGVFNTVASLPLNPIFKGAIYLGTIYLANATISDKFYKSVVSYEIEGWRPNKIVQKMGGFDRDINLYYRSPDDPNSIRDSQISRINYKGPNGEDNNIVYTYNNDDVLVRVDYPAGNPITYEYIYKNQNLNDSAIQDRGWLLSAVNHPSGFRSEYTYKWFQPNNDVTTLLKVTDDENKSWAYYLVTNKKHNGTGVDAREWKYEYRDGAPYSLYASDSGDTSRRWYFKQNKITDPLNLQTKKQYIMGMLELVTYPDINVGTIWATHHRDFYAYDLEGGTYQLLRKMELKNTAMHEKFFEYDQYGQIKKITDMGFYKEDDPWDQRITYINYDDSLHAALDSANIYGLVKEQWLEEPSKNTGVKYQHVWNNYDSKGNLLEARKFYDATNYISDFYNYDSNGNVITHTDPKGVQTNFTYQYNAYPQTETKVIDGKTFQTERAYSQWTGALFSEKDENNYLKTYAYDKLGRRIKETHPDATFVQTNYLDSQYRTEVTDRKTRKTIYNYNPFGELKTITDPLNNTTTYITDKVGRLSTIRLADNREYKYSYDEIGRPIRITYPDGTYARKAYEDGNNSILVWDENDHGMEYWYDAYGNLTKVVRGDIQEAGTIHYEYDGNDALTKIITPLDYEINFTNDLLGRRKSKTQPNGDVEYFNYDQNSNLTLHTNYEAKPINFSYDGLNRPKTETYLDNQFNVSYTYDSGAYGLGKVTSVTDRSGTAQFKYNQLGLMTQEDKTLDSTNYQTKYNYDNTGLLTSIEYPQVNGVKFTVGYTYDELDRIKTVTLQENAGPAENLITNTYDNTGRLTQKDYGNGLRETYDYDSKDRLTEHLCQTSTGNQIFKYEYKYDNAGNIVQRDIADRNVIRRRDSYEYDYINQLKKVDVPGNKDLAFAYDRQFNRLFMNHGFGTITYNYNTAMNYLTEWKEDTDGNGQYELAVQYDYNKQGNPNYKVYRDVALNKEVSRETYIWNDRDELVGISGRVTNNFIYDYEGLRVKTNSAKYLYLQNNQPEFKYNVSENYYDVFVYEGSKRILRARINNMGAISKETFINDYQGSPVVIIDDSQNIKYQNYNDPWGNMEMSIGSPTSNPEFKYTDKELDEESDLYYFHARYYDSKAGRFLGRDRVKLEGNGKNFYSLNPYQFSNNNPITYVDLDGNEVNPIKNGVLSSYIIGGKNKHMFNYSRGYLHTGWDIDADMDAPIRAYARGKIIKIRNDLGKSGYEKNSYGNYIMIYHPDTGKVRKTGYNHIASVKKGLKVGDWVEEGEIIAYTGKSGNAGDKFDKNGNNVNAYIDPHVHFMMYDDKNKFLNPGNFLMEGQNYYVGDKRVTKQEYDQYNNIGLWNKMNSFFGSNNKGGGK